jgi:LacI family transcriptional regulator
MKATRRVTVMIDLDWPLSHHFHIFAGIHRYARECEHWKCATNPHADQTFTGKQRNPRPDGIIARATPALVERARAAKVPVVNVWLNTRAQGVPSVFHDAEESGRMAARHLLAHGFRRFGYLGYSHDRCARLQLAGFRDTLREAGCECSVCLVSRHSSRSGAEWRRFQQTLEEWIGTWSTPVGIFTLNDLSGRYLVEACQHLGLQVPSDVAVLSSFNDPMICNNPEPALSSIDFGFEMVGYRAAQLLDQLMDGAPPPKEPILIAPANIIIRQSTNAFAAEDPVVSGSLQYIAEHVTTAIAVDDVAQHVAVTRRTLARLFQKSLGKSIHQTITHMRLERVKRELIETTDALKAIAHRCGFRDVVHLCKFFQREEKMTPTEYRAKRAVLSKRQSDRRSGSA